MAWIADASLAAAVSEAGGHGIIAAMNADAEWLREQIHELRRLTDKPFGVNVMLMSPFADEVAQVVIDEKVPVVVTSAGGSSSRVHEGLARCRHQGHSGRRLGGARQARCPCRRDRRRGGGHGVRRPHWRAHHDGPRSAGRRRRSADAEALHVRLADEAYCIGGSRLAESHLNEGAVLTTAVKSGAKAIHPGYGFFSENAGFVRECEKCGLAFVGPSAEVIDRMGDKDAARRTARAAGVPVVPGCDLLKSPEEAEREARRIGCPVLIKARSGGGGRGIRKVERAEDAGRAFSEARAEAEAAFGDGSFYFMEMNTRLQVEHPVTEFVTDVDLVKWQLRVAAGQALPFECEDLPVAGHAMECRINAETPDYLPSYGTVTMLHVPGGPKVRFDSALFPGAVVPPYYDSMLAKVIVCASTRDGTIRKMRSALGELVIEGVDENSELQLRILANEEFLSGNYHTNLMEGINAAQ